jgi:hypothetical protein
MVAKAVIPSQAGNQPDIVVAHWHSGLEQWVIGDVAGEDRKGVRRTLVPIQWAEIELPPETELRPLTVEDLKG